MNKKCTLTPPEGLADSAAGLACFCTGFLAAASFPPSVLDVAAVAGLAAVFADPPVAGLPLISAFSAHSLTYRINYDAVRKLLECVKP